MMSEGESIDRRAQLRALVRVARYRPVFTAAIIGAGVFAAMLEAVGLSFIVPDTTAKRAHHRI
jgi:subfamily B ATP-binding cassette protein MsbA